MPDTVEHSIETILRGAPLEGDEAEICDFTIEEQNAVQESQGVVTNVSNSYRPVVGETVTYVVAAVLLNEKNEVLMIQEAKKTCAGKW